MRFFHYAIVAAVVSVAGLMVVSNATALSVDEALQLSQKTGRPILAMAGSKDCGACLALEKRLVTDAQLRPLIAHFIPLKIDTQGPDWGTWSNRFTSTGNTIPKVYVVRADGELLYGESNSLPGAELPTFLAQMLGQAGASVSEKLLEQMESALLAANKLVGEQQTEKAVQTIAPLLGSGSFASAAVEIDKLGQQFIDEGVATSKAAESKLSDPSQAFDGALELVALERTHAKLPPVVQAVREVVKQHRRDATIKELLTQAELVDRAKAYEDKKQGSRALAAYEAIAARYQDKPGGEFAQARLAELEPAGGERNSDARTASTARPVSTESEAAATPALSLRKAASLLKMGKTLLDKRPEKAREYLTQVVELAPKSDAASEAQELLEGLR